jgi:hypothetical protein
MRCARSSECVRAAGSAAVAGMRFVRCACEVAAVVYECDEFSESFKWFC